MTESVRDEIPDGWGTFEDYAAEYRAAVDGMPLELPDGIAMPAYPPPELEPTLYMEGTGRVYALMTWLTIVETAAVRAQSRGDVAEAQRWVEVAAGFAETDTFREFNDHDHDEAEGTSWLEGVITPARAGNFAPMAADCGTDYDEDGE